MKKNPLSLKNEHRQRDYNQISLDLSNYKQVLLDITNAKDPNQARKVIIGSLQEWFDFKTPTLEVIEVQQKRLKGLFDDLNNATDLLCSDKIHNFTFDYIPIRSEAVVEVQEDGTIGESPIHLRNRPFGDILTHCVIKLFSDDRNVKLLHKCENKKCGKFFLSKRVKKKHTGGIRFCSDKCRFNFHSHRRILSGEAKKYKRGRYWEGKDQ